MTYLIGAKIQTPKVTRERHVGEALVITNKLVITVISNKIGDL